MKTITVSLLVLGLGLASAANAQHIPSLKNMADGIHHWNLEHAVRTYARYTPEQYEQIADNLIAYQNPDGGWPKNIDWLAILPTDSVYNALKERYKRSTLDNRNTYSQIDYLAEVFTLTGQPRYRDAAIRGIEYLLRMQKKNGGWRGWDVDAITYNDEVTTGVLELFLRISKGDSHYTWLDEEMKEKIHRSLRKGIDIVLRTQYVQNGVKTVWGQQHDNVTLLPVQARTFELPSLVSTESCSVLRLLMEIPHPDASVIEAVKAGVAWLERSAIQGIRVEKTSIAPDQITNAEYPYDLKVVTDEKAPRIWARFYELDTNRPFMATRSGKKVYRLADVDPERRMGYDWYTYAPESILQAYPDWLKKVEMK